MNKNFLRKIYTTNIVSNFVNLLGKPWKGNGAILTYHRILPDEKIKEDLDVGLAVLASNFEKQIKLLKTNYDIVSIDDVERINELIENVDPVEVGQLIDALCQVYDCSK